MPESEELLLAGELVGAHGIRGEVKINPFVEDASLISTDAPVFLKFGDAPLAPCELVQIRPHKNLLLAVLKDVKTRTDAEALVGGKFYVEKDRLPALDADTYYWDDLIGMAVERMDGVFFGTLVSIIPTPANDVYVIRDNQEQERLIPAIDAIVKAVDIEHRRMVIDPPNGL